jgi:hypothetical protein
VTYDEHGGFFDHVAPPAATQVDPTAPATYGVRVPAFFISPWVNGGAVFGHDGIYTGGGGVTKNSGAVQGSIAAVAVNPAVGAAAGVTAVSEKPPAAAAPAAAGDAQLGSVIGLMQPLHFDHTSILKTISRRFMNQNPPYMGARYEDANDLSAVLGSEPRPNQFLPFIPYNFVYGPSQKRLDVQSASTTPGALVWQYDPNTTNAQQFNFEDAGGGFWYIRTNTGSLYLTATATGVIQDVKYPAGTAALPGKNPDSQRWQLHSGGVTVIGASSYTVSNAAFPGKVLQPSGGSATSGTPVVLGAPQKAVTVFSVPNPWQVTSPLLPSNQLVSTTS